MGSKGLAEGPYFSPELAGVRRWGAGAAGLALAGLLVGCGRDSLPPSPEEEGGGVNPAESASARTFQVEGVVRELRPEERVVVIEHKDIAGYMKSMTMPFDVKDTNELAGLLSGDRVRFRMLVTEEEGWIDSVKRIGREAAPPSREGPRRVRLVEPLEPGETVPDYGLTNQFGQPIRLSDFRGDVVGMTFLFTRCPFPNFCPRLSGNFADAAGLLAAQAAPTNWHLLSVSFDPDNDTPEVLRRYAESYRADPERWSFATGDMEEIDALTEQFGLVFGRDGDSISHNARTAVLDPEGRVSLIITGNVWSVEVLVEAMTAAARSGGDTVERDE